LEHGKWVQSLLGAEAHEYGDVEAGPAGPYESLLLQYVRFIRDYAIQVKRNEPPIDYKVTLRTELDRRTEDIRTAILEAKVETVQNLEEQCESLSEQNQQLRKDHEGIQLAMEEIEKEVRILRAKNHSMAQLLSVKYSGKNLFLGSTLSILAMSGSLALHALRGITVIHPLLALVILAVGIGFMFLAIQRRQGENGQQ
jgi:hypothetical protein